MTEQQIQNKIIKKLELSGYYVINLIRTNKAGIPDLIAIKENECFFVEVKKPAGKLSEVQKFRINELRNNKIKVMLWQDYEQEFNESKTESKYHLEQSNF